MSQLERSWSCDIKCQRQAGSTELVISVVDNLLPVYLRAKWSLISSVTSPRLAEICFRANTHNDGVDQRKQLIDSNVAYSQRTLGCYSQVDTWPSESTFDCDTGALWWVGDTPADVHQV